MWSILMYTCYRLAKREEKGLEEQFGEEFRRYRELVPEFSLKFAK